MSSRAFASDSSARLTASEPDMSTYSCVSVTVSPSSGDKAKGGFVTDSVGGDIFLTETGTRATTGEGFGQGRFTARAGSELQGSASGNFTPTRTNGHCTGDAEPQCG